MSGPDIAIELLPCRSP